MSLSSTSSTLVYRLGGLRIRTRVYVQGALLGNLVYMPIQPI